MPIATLILKFFSKRIQTKSMYVLYWKQVDGIQSCLSVCLHVIRACLTVCVCVWICQVVFLCATGGCKSLEISQKCSEQLGFSVGGRHLLLSQNTLPYCNRPARHVLQQLAKNKKRHMHIPHVWSMSRMHRLGKLTSSQILVA